MLNFDELKFSEKLNYLEYINEIIEYKLKSIDQKENKIKNKINTVKKKLTEAFLSNENIFNHFKNHLEQSENLKIKVSSYRNKIIEIYQKIKQFESIRENLKLVKYKFESKYLSKIDINNLKEFANNFLHIYQNLSNNIDEINLLQYKN